MVRTTMQCVALAFAMSTGSAAQEGPGDPGPGVPLALAKERAARISNLRYELHVGIPEAPQEPVRTRVILRFDLKDASKPLALDFAADKTAVSRAILNGDPVLPEAVVDHLLIPAKHLKNGANEFTLD